jgi:hypothetical protein
MEINMKNERTTEYIFSIIFNLIFFYIVNNLLNWNIYFITPALNEVLWIINLSIIATIIGNILLLLYSSESFRHVMKIIINTINFVAVYYVYVVFPFNFNNSFYNWVISIFIILIMIGLVIASLVEVYQFANKK